LDNIAIRLIYISYHTHREIGLNNKFNHEMLNDSQSSRIVHKILISFSQMLTQTKTNKSIVIRTSKIG